MSPVDITIVRIRLLEAMSCVDIMIVRIRLLDESMRFVDIDAAVIRYTHQEMP